MNRLKLIQTKISILLTLFTSLNGFSKTHEKTLTEEDKKIEIEGHLCVSNPYRTRITTQSSLFGDNFQFEDFENGVDNTIKRTVRFFETFDLYKNDGTFDATLKNDWKNYQPFISSYRSYTVKGADGSTLGRIHSTPFTTNDQKFFIYDRNNKHQATAFLNKFNKELQINFSSAPSTGGIATLKKESLSNESLMSVSKPKKLDHRLLKFLSTLVIDKHFKESSEAIKIKRKKEKNF